jgi:hypothetical protein
MAMEFLAIPLWMVLCIGLPILTVLLVIASVYFNFRESLQMQDVPTHGYAPRIRDLDQEAREIEPLGFRKTDQFYLKTIPDSVSYVFKHESEPFYLCVYHLGQKFFCDVLTRFENDYHLTTNNTVDSGISTRPEKSLLQIFPHQPYRELLDRHKESFEYIKQSGIRPFDIAELEFRRYFMKSYREHASYMKKLFLWPVALIFRTLSRPGKAYCKSIKEQYPEGIPRF